MVCEGVREIIFFFLETRNLSRSLKHMEMKSGHLLVLLQVSKYLFFF